MLDQVLLILIWQMEEENFGLRQSAIQQFIDAIKQKKNVYVTKIDD